LLVISPDYASHALPMIQVASAWTRTRGEAIVATGESTRPMVHQAGLAWISLRLGKGSNPGVIEESQQPTGEDQHLRAFFDATRQGPVATLLYQADARRHDLLHQPDRVLDRLADIVGEVQPDRILVDHVAFGARLALHALGIQPASIVLGHPSALPTPGEVYGLPPEWPMAMRPDADSIELLTARCRASVDDLGDAAEDLLHRRSPAVPQRLDLTSTPGQPTIYVYPEALHDRSRSLPANHVFIGSLARSETLVDQRLPSGRGPRVLVALGSFLSARDDVLRCAVDAAATAGWRLVLAHGSTPLEQLGVLPAGAIVERHIAQVAWLRHTDVLITHGGNGSVTEAAAAGVPMVVLPFSTDQFSGAAAIERAGLGTALAPNQLAPVALAAAVDSVMRSDAADRARAVAQEIATGGPERAADAIAVHGCAVARPGERGWISP
jgi:MGT family glycosyltransferase